MKSKLPNLILLVLVGAGLAVFLVHIQERGRQSGVAGASSGADVLVRRDGSNPGQLAELVERAILTIEGRHSVSAKVRQSVDLFGKQLVGSGIYLECRSEQGTMFRFEMRVQLSDYVNSLMDISDGRYLWRYRKLRDDQVLERVDLWRVNQALEEAGRTREPGQIALWPGLGGLARLLGGLNSAFDFVSIEQTDLWGQRAWKLGGQWKRGKLEKLLPRQEAAIREGKPADLSDLAEHLPDRVVLFLSAEDLFPHRIEFHRRTVEDSDEMPAGTDRLIACIDFLEVNLNLPVDPARFMYSPGNVVFTDETDKVLEKLGVKK
jgi:hypothetical protein